MRASPINSRKDILRVIAGQGRTKACNIAIEEGSVTLLGGFIPPEGLPFWGVMVTSEHYHKTWFLKIEADQKANTYRVQRTGSMPWEYWAGDSAGAKGPYNGEMPLLCGLHQVEALKAKIIIKEAGRVKPPRLEE